MSYEDRLKKLWLQSLFCWQQHGDLYKFLNHHVTIPPVKFFSLASASGTRDLSQEFLSYQKCPRIEIFRKFLSYWIKIFGPGQKFSENFVLGKSSEKSYPTLKKLYPRTFFLKIFVLPWKCLIDAYVLYGINFQTLYLYLAYSNVSIQWECGINFSDIISS